MIECLVDLPENFANHIYLENSPNDEHDLSITLHKVLSSPAFISLKHLYLENIPTLFEIPDNITLLSSLESLMLIDMAITSLPENIKHLPQLNQLNVCECKKLQSIPALSQFIPFFIVLDCESLEKVKHVTNPILVFLCSLTAKNWIYIHTKQFWKMLLMGLNMEQD
jgi:Leucine-rich repeat (LRR) protein